MFIVTVYTSVTYLSSFCFLKPLGVPDLHSFLNVMFRVLYSSSIHLFFLTQVKKLWCMSEAKG